MAILTISRAYGSGGRKAGQQAAQQMGYAFVDKEMLFADLKARGEVWARLGLEVDEVKPDLWERHDWRYQAYLAQLESVIMDHAAGDRVVIVGRGGNMILKGAPLCLRVRIDAPLEFRVKMIMAREGIEDQARAEELVRRVDQERAGYIKSNYGCDWCDSAAFDLAFDTGSMTLDQVTKAIVDILRQKDAQATDQDRQRLTALALAARLKARLKSERKLLLPTLTVNWTPEAIVVESVIHNPEEQALIERLTAEVCGQAPVTLKLHPRL